MIKISRLKAIETPHQFFDTKKILMIELIKIGVAITTTIEDFGTDAITHQGEVFLPIVLAGSPENLLLNCCNGVPFSFKSGLKGIYYWDKDLNGAIADGKIFDFSDHHQAYKAGRLTIDKEPKFLVSRYLATPKAA